MIGEDVFQYSIPLYLSQVITMSLNLLLKVIYVSILLCNVVQGTLTPDSMVSLDCGSQQTFTCSVTGGVAVWMISGLSGASVEGGNGLFAASRRSRITTNDTSSATPSSTITITGFTTADNGGTIQCINQMGANTSFQGMANISVGPPSCSANDTSVRIDNFMSTTVTWQQPPNTPPVTSTTVTYCPTSSPNCGNSMNCTSPCTISELDPCVNYSITITPTNNCGNATGCNGSMVADKGIPSCPTDVKLDDSTLQNNGCDVSLTWQQLPYAPPVTSTTVTYCPTSSPNCGDSLNCTTSPCTIKGLLNNTEYQFTVIPNNNCGSPTGCTGNNATHRICPTDTTPTTDSKSQAVAPIGLIIGVVVAFVLLALIIAIIATILICCFCLGDKGCKSGSDAKNKPLREEQPREDYVDSQTVRDNKEMNEENGITYAALQFSEEAGGNGKNDIHRKKELDNVQYSEVEHLQV